MIRKLNCGSPHTKDGIPLVGVGYEVLINYRFDAHARNDNGGFGKSFMAFVDSKAIADCKTN